MRKVFSVTILLTLAVALYAAVPRPATKLTAKMPDGTTKTLASLKGKVVCVEVLNTGCPYCQRSGKAIEAVYQELHSKGFEVFGVATNNPDVNGIQEFRSKSGATFPIGVGTQSEILQFLQLSPVMMFYVPQVVFVDKTGTVRGHYTGTDSFLGANEEANIRKMAEQLMAE